MHISQFLIIDGAGPVASTVVGHFKTCFIISIGWVHSQRPLKDGSMVGILLAVGGIVAYVPFLYTRTIPLLTDDRYSWVTMEAPK